MTAYDFHPREEAQIVRGRQATTLRKPWGGRNGHARIGDAVQLYVHKRTPQARLIGQSVCILRGLVLIDPDGARSTLPLDLRTSAMGVELRFNWSCVKLERIAYRLGHERWDDLVARLTQDFGAPPWSLELIGWEPLTPAQRVAA